MIRRSQPHASAPATVSWNWIAQARSFDLAKEGLIRVKQAAQRRRYSRHLSALNISESEPANPLNYTVDPGATYENKLFRSLLYYTSTKVIINIDVVKDLTPWQSIRA